MKELLNILTSIKNNTIVFQNNYYEYNNYYFETAGELEKYIYEQLYDFINDYEEYFEDDDIINVKLHNEIMDYINNYNFYFKPIDIELTGNNGVDYIKITQNYNQFNNNTVFIEIGYCCVVIFKKVVRVEFLTGLFNKIFVEGILNINE